MPLNCGDEEVLFAGEIAIYRPFAYLQIRGNRIDIRGGKPLLRKMAAGHLQDFLLAAGSERFVLRTSQAFFCGSFGHLDVGELVNGLVRH